jgi:hypothetical protein
MEKEPRHKCMINGCDETAEQINTPQFSSGIYCRKHFNEINGEPSKINIVDWFEPYNLEHLRQYRRFEKFGNWGFEFIPEYVEFTTGWQIGLVAKLANAHLDRALGKEE